MIKFCIVEEKTGETWGIRDTLSGACASADVFRIGTGNDFAVLETKTVYSTSGSEYVLSSFPRALKDSWERFRAVRDRLTTRRG